MVSVKVNKTRTVPENNGNHAVLNHLSELDVGQTLEPCPRHVPRIVVGGVAQGGRGLKTVLKLDCENL